jgi:hypothetical protein
MAGPLGRPVAGHGDSANEGEPAQPVAKPLVVEDEFSDRAGKLNTLPLALPATSTIALALRSSSALCLDRIGGGTEFVGGNVGDHPGLTSGVCRISRSSGQVPGCGIGMASCRPCLSHRDLTPRPGTPHVDRPARTIVPRVCLLEVVQHMLRAVGRPDCEEAVVVILEAAAATHGDEPRIPDLGEDHQVWTLMIGIRSNQPN